MGSVTPDASPAGLEPELAALGRTAEAFAARYQGRVARLDAAALQEALRDYEVLLAAVYHPQVWASLAHAVATDDDAVRARHDRVDEAGTAAFNHVRFFDLELGAVPVAVHEAWLADEGLAPYRHHLRRMRAQAPYRLAGPVENALATKDLTGRRAWSQLYTEQTAAWRFPFEVDGTRRELNLAEVRALRAHGDREIRARAQRAVLERLEREAPLLGYLVNVLYQDHRLENALRGFGSPEAPTLLDDEIAPATMEALMSAVEDHYPVAQEYFRLKARVLGLPRLAMHDLLAPYPDAGPPVDFATARAQVLEAYAALDPDVAEVVRGFFTEARIDAEPRAGKRDGAFCAGMLPGTAPRVLLNYTGHLHDVLTLAHELGHGVHFTLAGRRQGLLGYWPTTPMAETASVFGEMVLTRRLLASGPDPAVRRQLLAIRIEEALGTIHRQVAFTRYERNAHARRAQGPVPVDELGVLWSREGDRLYGDAVERSALDRFGWGGVPHLLHFRFYCYAYAFGQLLVFALYRQWEHDGAAFVPRYLDLLGRGGSAGPEALLAAMGIDLADPDFWRRGLEVVTGMVEDFAREQ